MYLSVVDTSKQNYDGSVRSFDENNATASVPPGQQQPGGSGRKKSTSAPPPGGRRGSKQPSIVSRCDENIDYDALYEDSDEPDVEMDSQGSVIRHLLSQVKIGMDLTKVVLPTFILERRSLLEMYADYFAHPDLFIRIADQKTPRDRMVAVVRWYLGSYHAGRKSSVAKKPYNPILGEVFRCHWEIPSPKQQQKSQQKQEQKKTTVTPAVAAPAAAAAAPATSKLPSDEPKQTTEESSSLVPDGPVPWCKKNQLTFVAEQVSHHPPISAFYAEHYNKRITFNAHVYTKSKFLGLSVCVYNIGEGTVSVLDHDEDYVVTFPNGYGRSILTVPWIELGGPVTITCTKTGYHCNVEFLTKPFYGTKKHKVTAEVFAPDKKSFLSIQGEWNGVMEAKWNDKDVTEVFLDVNSLDITKKQVRPIAQQDENESRRLWKEVTAGLKFNDIDKATTAKQELEQRQRDEAKERKDAEQEWETKVPAAFDRAVLIIIDALRLDFVTPNLMPFTANFITTKDGLETNGEREIQNGCFVTVKAETPTVTLPRIKALISGDVPQFIDVVLNLIGSSNNEGLEDSLVHQARVKRKNIVFYGDDTWLRLFPKHFERSEGTTSFYVNDFTEVDRNVTRNVRKELDRTDWDIMILHYLGLDHIGHVYGPKSSLVPEKLTEMDSIIKEIWEKTNADRGQLSKSTKTLVIVTSDHGMKDGGGHGGATYPETHVPLVLLGQPCTSPVAMLQTDIVANLCVLLGLNVPRTSIGRLRSELLGHLSLTEYLNALRYNTEFLRTKSQACSQTIADKARSYHEEFVDGLQKNKSASDVLGRQAVKTYEECSDVLGENLVTLSVKQNWLGLVLSLMVMAAILFEISSKCPNGNSVATIAILLLLWQHFDAGSVAGSISGAIFVVWVVAKSLKRICFLLYSKFSYVIFMTLVHPLTFVSSSFVEEEHQFWYWVLGNYLLISAVKMAHDSHHLAYKSGDSCQKNNVKFFADFCFETALPIVGLRFLRTLNQVGDQWAAEPDLSDFLLKPENFICMQIFHVTGLFLTFYVSLEPLANKSVGKVDSISNFLILLGIYLFRTLPDLTSPNKLSVVVAGQSLWLLILSKVLVYILTGSGSLVNVWVLIITLLLKPHNAILIPYCSLVSGYVRRKFSGKNPTLNAVLHIWLANTLYFAQGHCNTLASIDVGSAYVGLSSYQPFLVGLQLVSHTYALPVLSHLLLLTEHVRKTDITDRFHRRNVRRFDDSFDSISQIFLVNFTYRLYVIFVVFLVTFVQRHHLFIWSVFAPKVFIETGHFCLICLEFGLATLFFALLRMKEYIRIKVKR